MLCACVVFNAVCLCCVQCCVPVLCSMLCACVVFNLVSGCVEVFLLYHVCPQPDLAARSPQVWPAPINSDKLPLSPLPRTAQGGAKKEEGRRTVNEGE